MSVFSRSNAARWRPGASTAARSRCVARRAGAPARRRAHARVLHDGRQVHLGDVVRPVDRTRVERERRAVLVVELIPDVHEAVDAVDRLALGVRAVELDVAQRPFDVGPALLESSGHLCGSGRAPAAPRTPSRPARACAWLAAAGPAPCLGRGRTSRATTIGWPGAVVERMLAEPVVHEVDEAAVAQRVRRAGRDLHDRRRLLGAERGDRADRADDEVDRDDVDRAFGHARELLAAGPARRR